MMRYSSRVGRFVRTIAAPVAIVCTLALGIMSFADTYLSHTVDQTVARYAESGAMGWINDVIARTPEIEEMTRGREPHPRVIEALHASAAKNGIFRLKLYSPKGALLLDLEDPDRQVDLVPLDAQARGVFLGEPSQPMIVRSHDAPDLPEVYTRTYLRVADADGHAFGVIEVLIDSTDISHTLLTVFRNLSRLLIWGSALVYLIPSLWLILKTEQVRVKDKALVELSHFDPLTGLLNRRELNARTARLFARRQIEPIGILFFDVDRFKTVNDELGHDFGDNLLRHISAMVQQALGVDDLAGRVGGDEFMVVSPFATSVDLLDLGLAIQGAMETPFTHNGTTITPSLSIGAHVSLPGESKEAAIYAADLATYRAKANGRGQLVLFTAEIGEEQNRRRAVEATLRQAMATDEGLYAEFQPIFGEAGSEVIGFEALMRLRRDDGTLISPAEFIPIAEESGLIVAIGEKFLARVLATARTWPGQRFVSVNLSAVQFRDGRIADMVGRCIRETGFDPARLELEVTESLILEYEDQVQEQLARLRAIGVRIALDDFGTGYSSLGYLWKYQFDKLKIDRAFLEGFDIEVQKYRQVIDTIIVLGQNLGMTVTVEGVERPHQLTMLTEMGCDQFQGFLLGRPLSAEAAMALMSPPERSRAAG